MPDIKRRRRLPDRWSLAQRVAHYSAAPNERGCILWGGCRDINGYGRLVFRGRCLKAHRAAWELKHGPIQKGLHLCHHCDVPACINPEHLFLGTRADNIADMVAKGRQARGERAGGAKLTTVLATKVLTAAGPQHEIAKRFGINQSQVSRIKRGERWALLREGVNSAGC
jgi:hypothetical protein